VMNAGRIEQIGRPLELYDHPANLFVASFLGSPSMNFAEGVIVNRAQGPGLALQLADGAQIALESEPDSATPGAKVTLGVRPEHIETVTPTPDATLEVEVVEPTGAETHLYGKIGGNTWCVTTRQRSKVEPGQRVTLRLPAEHIHLFDTESGRRLV
jgi:multiple sugar transport system ATP-binding protein